MNREKIRILIVSGTLETSLHPVPPVADGSPEWNVFRLAEAAACHPDSLLEIHVVSPCETGQVTALQNHTVQAQGKYRHIVFRTIQLNLYRKLLRHILPLRLIVRRLAKLPDLMSWWYLRRVHSVFHDLKPDLVILNDRPQYIRFMRRIVEKGRLFLMLRYPLGESSRFLCLLGGVIVNSNGMKSYAEQFIREGSTPVYKIPNTLDVDFSTIDLISDRSTGRGKKVILFAGRLIEEKGARELLLAFRKVFVQYPNSLLLICGAFSKKASLYEQTLYQIAEEFPKGVVAFMGYVSNQQMYSYYIQADVAVFPSLPRIFIESFGMVALEAMRCGIPVVASRQPGFEELIVHGETGLLVDDPCDAKSLAQAILMVLQDSALAQRMGQAGYERSLNFTPERGLRALESIFQSAMSGQT